ncbi:MAG TPA: hypothetical protein VMS56_04225 [Thermoanaerobaculia bacterium]|nr:hypothetical protein [Thermoanaerobaculia bacterium]
MRRLVPILVVALVVGCGKAGPPRPPVPQIPRAASDLVVAQQGPTLLLAWSFPTLTTAGTTLRSVERMHVDRVVEELPITAMTALTSDAAVQSDDDLPLPLVLFSRMPPLAPPQFRAQRIRLASLEGDEIPRAIAGARIVFRDNPPLQTSDGRPIRLHYAVVVESDQAESEISNIASIVPLAVGLPPRSLTASAEAVGVELTWSPPPTSILGGDDPVILGYHVYRVSPPGESAGVEVPVVALEPPLNEALLSDTAYRDVPTYGSHRYLVTAVASKDPQRSESHPASTSEVEFRDLTPPPPPANLVTLAEDEAIRLVWDPVEAPDLAGYRVYRETDRGRVSLAWEPIAETSFRDTRLEPAETYVYYVSSVDENGNESELTPSAPAFSPR